jgi:xylulokinase
MDFLLGLDVGTTAVKAVLFDLDGRPAASASQPISLITPHEGWVEQDPQAMWQAVTVVLRQVAGSLKQHDRVLALSQSSQGGTTIPVDSSCRPTYNAISWMDQRAKDERLQIEANFGAQEIYTTTGWPLITALPLLHISWLRYKRPQVFQRSRRFLFVNDFIGYLLTGEFCMDPSNASITQLLNLSSGDWENALLDLAGLKRDQLSPLAPSGYVFGEMTSAAEQATGLPAGIPVANGAHDQYCTAISLDVTRPGPVLLSCGTAWVILAVPESLEVGLRSGMAISRHAVEGRLGALRSLGGVGASSEWLLDNLWSRPASGNELRGQRYQEFNHSVARSEPGAGGLLFFPLAGGHTEGYGMGRGGFLHLSLKHTRDDIARAVMEGLAYELRWSIEEISSAGVVVNKLKMVAGAARSPIWPQIISDVTGLTVIVPQVTEAASQGAALLAGAGAGVFSLPADTGKFAGAEKVFEPNLEYQPRYNALFEKYRSLCPLVC